MLKGRGGTERSIHLLLSDGVFVSDLKRGGHALWGERGGEFVVYGGPTGMGKSERFLKKTFWKKSRGGGKRGVKVGEVQGK